jgi:hypothetical protein
MWHGTRWRNKGNRSVRLDGEKKTPSGRHYADILAACAFGIHLDAGPEVFLPGIWTSDDDLLALLDSLTVVLATCGIRSSNEAFENTQSRLLLLSDSEEEE